VLQFSSFRLHCDWLRGLNKNVIMGRLIPAGTGMEYYRRAKIAGEDAVEEEPAPDQEVSVNEKLQAYSDETRGIYAGGLSEDLSAEAEITPTEEAWSPLDRGSESDDTGLRAGKHEWAHGKSMTGRFRPGRTSNLIALCCLSVYFKKPAREAILRVGKAFPFEEGVNARVCLSQTIHFNVPNVGQIKRSSAVESEEGQPGNKCACFCPTL
jgi:hypothetical protein